ncbi:hypothetical protein BH09ACT11_BH09ACT11_17600 [soil metagenome]
MIDQTIGDEQFLGSFTIGFEHGLLIVQAPGRPASHGGWDPKTERIHVDDDSIYVCVLFDDDGPVRVDAIQSDDPASWSGGLKCAYSGKIPHAEGMVNVGDSDGIVQLRVLAGLSGDQMAIFVDDDQFPTRVVLAFQ